MLKLVWAIVSIATMFLDDAKTGYLLVEIEDSKEVYQPVNKFTKEPPTLPTPPEEPRPCCKAANSYCLSQCAGITEEEYCKSHPETPGCVKAQTIAPPVSTVAPDVPTLPTSPPEKVTRAPYGEREPKPHKMKSENETDTARAIPRGCYNRWGRYCESRVSISTCRNRNMRLNCALSCGECECDGNQFECSSFVPGRHDGAREKCIPEYYLCDGDRDCPGSEDENRRFCIGGSSQEGVGRCRNNQFECNNGQCIPEAYECDGETIWGHDCDDRSDEHRGCNRFGRFRQYRETCGWYNGRDYGTCDSGLYCARGSPGRCYWD